MVNWNKETFARFLPSAWFSDRRGGGVNIPIQRFRPGTVHDPATARKIARDLINDYRDYGYGFEPGFNADGSLREISIVQLERPWVDTIKAKNTTA